MQGLVCFEIAEDVVEDAQVVGRRGGVGIEQCWERYAEDEVVLGAAGEFGGCEGREGEEVGGGKVQGVEPVDCAFVAGKKKWKVSYMLLFKR